MSRNSYTTLFLDVGGVLLSNGWDHHMRERAAELFSLDYNEMSSRHALTFDTYEIGKISLDVYLDRVVFYEPRSFSKETFKQFMYAQSTPFLKMIELVGDLKKQFQLKTVAVTNEGRELMEHRIQRFKMKEYIDFFVCSAFVHLRKPDEEIFQFALDMSCAEPQEVIYIDDRHKLSEIAKNLGMKGIHHLNYEHTHECLIDLLCIQKQG